MKTITMELTEEESVTLVALVTFVSRDIEDDLSAIEIVNKGEGGGVSQSTVYFLNNAFNLVRGLEKKLLAAAEPAPTGGAA